MSRPRQDRWRGKRVTVMGLGRFGGGLGVTRWLARKGARVTVSDQAPPEELAESIAALDGLGVELHLGRHEGADVVNCELLVVNPAVPFDSAYLGAARKAGVELTTEINLFLARCRAPVVGITGSAGKSTTTAMTSAILARQRPVHVGGNIGISLLDQLEGISPDHVVVLELSSFQLMYLPLLKRGPHVAVVTNLHPNHLDRHVTMEEYAGAKRNIFRFQGPEDVLVLNRDDEAVASWRDGAPGKVRFFSADEEPFDLKLPGRHNQANAQAAWVAASQFGLARGAAAEALAGFTGLPHRLQLVSERHGVRYFNDSKSTTPSETIAALESFPPRSVIAIVGGYDKKVEFGELCAALVRRAEAVVVTGQTGERIALGVESIRPKPPVPVVVRAFEFSPAVDAACELAQPGDVVLLSPASASFDQFRNYEQRGDTFIQLICEK